MLSLEEKITYFQSVLHNSEENYAESFKSDIVVFIDEFNVKNKRLQFLKNLRSCEEIDNWIVKLTSRIVLKFDPESEQINDFIYDFIENG